ncbi:MULTISPECIES: hypothetical protein [Trichocoleus]|uniref:Uncharacterized protein n=1 Tax=Trichocoleus desertorum GB2-A4 TaxID=2933944 RepID=A0ABV0J7K4_9CYAN|nr:hypothetical protein [Trichocoleus sp. FACHB-46]
MENHEINQLGSSLRQIKQTSIRSGEAGVVRLWYQGGEPYFDIFFELQDDHLRWFQFTLRGKSLSWSQRAKNVQTGTTDEPRINDTTYYSGSKLIQTNHTVDQNFVQLVRAILQTRADEAVFQQAIALLDSQAQT